MNKAEDRILEAGFEDVIILKDFSYDAALIGISEDNRAIYDYDLMVEYLMEEEGWNGRGFIYKPSREEQKNRVAESLTRFRYFITSVQNGELDLTNPRSIWSNKDLEWYSSKKIQLDFYDYELYC